MTGPPVGEAPRTLAGNTGSKEPNDVGSVLAPLQESTPGVTEINQLHSENCAAAKSTGPFEIILADPPWRYNFSRSKSRKIENQYPTATIEEICAHSPAAAPNSILFLWSTSPKLIEAFRVMEAWGFTYRSGFVWDKVLIGMGYWFRGQHETLLVGTKGNPADGIVEPPGIFIEKRTRHSKKPECVYKWIEDAFPALEKLEMYARPPAREGWKQWGNEV